jgi:DNA-3-methyladenine glycosylase II
MKFAFPTGGWKMIASTLPYADEALRHLRKHDARFAMLHDAVGPFRLRIHLDRFRLLAECIISQQISTRAAKAISARLRERVRPRRLSAATILATSDEALREAGLSPQKCRYLRGLAERVVSGEVDLRSLHLRNDEEVIAHLVRVPGIGRWTAEMFLIFGLGRPDVLPVDDFGLRQALQLLEGLKHLPDRTAVRSLTACWRPFATVGTWYCWQWLAAARTLSGP